MPADRLAHLVEIHLQQRPVVRAAGGDHHVVDRFGQLGEEGPHGGRVGGVEGRGALRTDIARRLLQPVGIAAGEDDVGPLGSGPSSCLEPDDIYAKLGLISRLQLAQEAGRRN